MNYWNTEDLVFLVAAVEDPKIVIDDLLYLSEFLILLVTWSFCFITGTIVLFTLVEGERISPVVCHWFLLKVTVAQRDTFFC
jgi:hypothetical protein